MYQDRWYQIEAHDTFFEFAHSCKGNPLIAIPTGAGKSLIIARMVQTMFRNWHTLRAMMLTHVTKLVVQNAAKLREIWPHAPMGLCCAELRKKETQLPIIYGSIQTVFNLLKKDINACGKIDVLFVDEAHLVGTEDTAAYVQTIAFLQAINPNIIVCGLSATCYREKLGELTEGGVFTHLIYDLTSYENFNRLVDEGYLCPVVSRPTNAKIDATGVKLTAGEYNQKQAAEAITDEIIAEGVRETIFWGQSEGRNACLAYASSVQKCEEIAEMFRYFGISAETVHSKRKDNEDVLATFENGGYQVVVSQAKLTTGYDFPGLDLVADFQLTNSTSRHVQKGGRLMRVYPGKSNGRYLDFAGNLERNGPFNDPLKPGKPGERGGVAPIKECPDCRSFNHTSVAYCGGKSKSDPRFDPAKGCGYPFPPPEQDLGLSGQASDAMAMRTEEKVYEWKPVQRVFYSKFQSAKSGQAAFLRVEYVSGSKTYSEAVRIEHPTARKYAEKWWKKRTDMAFPDSVDHALNMTNFLRKPKSIMVETTAKYPPVEDYEF